jgi:hypothetical protein
VEISEYAIIDGPQIPLNSASPTQYFPSLSSIGIDEASLDWKPSRDIPGENISASRLSLSIPKSGNVDTGNGEGVATMSVIMQAKKLVSDGLHVPLSAVEIIVRG